jgi:endoglucanase
LPRSIRRSLALALLALALLPAAAAATVSFSADGYTARRGAGDAIVTVVRSDGRGTAQVRYAVYDVNAVANVDYRPVSGRIDFADGQTTATFSVPILDDGFPKGPVRVRVGLYGAFHATLGTPNRADVTILDPDHPLEVRDPLNPLGLTPPPPAGNPLRGATFFVDRERGLASVVANKLRHSQPGVARELEAIAGQPETKRFGSWDPDPLKAVGSFIQRAAHTAPGAVPLIATYRLRHPRCGGLSDSPAEAAGYKRWYEQLAQAIHNSRVVVFMEIDGLITVHCLSAHGRQVRADELRSAIASLAALPHAVVYVDAGAADAPSLASNASMLGQIGVARIQGFFTNATHNDWTSREIRYGEALARRLGGGAGSHFVVNTAANGRGPLVPHDRVRHGNEIRCNPPGRGLGPKPTTEVPASYPHLDALIWIGNPGRSAGPCGPGNPPPTGTFYLQYALMLIRNADYRIR